MKERGSDEISSSTQVEGSYTILDEDPLLDEYGQHPQDVYKSHPEVLSLLQRLEEKFSEYEMNVSSGNEVVVFSDGRKMLFMKGCYPHACGDTNKIALFDPQSKKIYLGTNVLATHGTATRSPTYRKVFLGDPDPLVMKFLTEHRDDAP